jgi:hypothetical protein
MMYGEEIHEVIGGATNLNVAANTAVLTKPCYKPGSVLYWGVKITTLFNLTAPITRGVLTLFRYTKTIISATVNVAGTGYAVGDLISVVQAGASGGIVRVLTAALGLVLTVEVVNKGVNYIAGAATTVALNGTGDNALTLVIVDRLALDTLGLGAITGGAMGIAGKQYMRRVPNVLPDTSPSAAPPSCYNAGEDLVMVATIEANGTAETGAYLPVILYQNRAENFAAQPLWVAGLAL